MESKGLFDSRDSEAVSVRDVLLELAAERARREELEIALRQILSLRVDEALPLASAIAHARVEMRRIAEEALRG